MTKTIFTADTHFSQVRTLELSRRPFYSVESMNYHLIHNWNTIVDPTDIVYHLGDFGDPSIIGRLIGQQIRLLPGNYDTPEVLEQLQRDSRVTILTEEPWQLVTPVERTSLPRVLQLVHAPEDAVEAGAFHLYGHIHKLQMVKRNGLNVGVDCHDFYPIDYETVEFYYNAIMNHYDDNVFVEKLGG